MRDEVAARLIAALGPIALTVWQGGYLGTGHLRPMTPEEYVAPIVDVLMRVKERPPW